MKYFFRIAFVLLLVLAAGCMGTYTITTEDIKGGLSAVVGADEYRTARLTIKCNTPFKLEILVKGTSRFCGGRGGDTVFMKYKFPLYTDRGSFSREVSFLIAPAKGPSEARGMTLKWRPRYSRYNRKASDDAWLIEYDHRRDRLVVDR